MVQYSHLLFTLHVLCYGVLARVSCRGWCGDLPLVLLLNEGLLCMCTHIM